MSKLSEYTLIEERKKRPKRKVLDSKIIELNTAKVEYELIRNNDAVLFIRITDTENAISTGDYFVKVRPNSVEGEENERTQKIFDSLSNKEDTYKFLQSVYTVDTCVDISQLYSNEKRHYDEIQRNEQQEKALALQAELEKETVAESSPTPLFDTLFNEHANK